MFSLLSYIAMPSVKSLLGAATHHWAEVLASATVVITGVYALFTYFILRANRRVVSNMEAQTALNRQFYMRQHFLAGIAAIAEYDIASPGCEQAMRLLDYYSHVALSYDDPELFWILNTVMTAEIRKKLEEIQQMEQQIYVDAVAARLRIQDMLKKYHMHRKGLA